MSSDSMQQHVPYAVSPPRYSVSHQMVTTAFELPNYRIVQNLGVVRKIARDAIVLDQGRVVHASDAAGLLEQPELVRRLLSVGA